jgi:hypothetical protein
MQRITLADLNAVIVRINRETNSPAHPYEQQPDGSYRAQTGCYHLSRAYGGYSLHRMSNESGGVRDVFGNGHMPARELYARMHAFLAGMDAKAA